MSEPEINRHPDAKALAVAVADELTRHLQGAVADRGVAHLVLTGGGIGIAVLAELDRTARRIDLDGSNIHLWWGDALLLPGRDPERNETPAREALLDHTVHPPEEV